MWSLLLQIIDNTQESIVFQPWHHTQRISFAFFFLFLLMDAHSGSTHGFLLREGLWLTNEGSTGGCV